MRGLMLSDLHVGSKFGLCTEERACGDSKAYIRKAFRVAWRWVIDKWGKPDFLLLGGDVNDGQNPKNNASGLWTADLEEQADEAAAVIEEVDAGEVLIVGGSGYHDQVGNTGMYVGSMIADRVDATKWDCVGLKSLAGTSFADESNTKSKCVWHGYIDVEDVRIHLQHKISVSRVWHCRATPLARAMMNAKLADTDDKKASIVVRGHSHHYMHLEYSTCHGFVLPAWKGLDDHLLADDPLAMAPTIGAVSIEINGEDVKYEQRTWPLEVIQPVPTVRVGKHKRRRWDGRATDKSEGS